MDNFPPNAGQDPVTQAAEFFIEFRAGDATPAVRARFEKWLRSSPENVQAYLEIAAGWSELPTEDPEDRIDIRVLLAAAHNLSDRNVIYLDLSRADARAPLKSHRMQMWALVASLALLVVLGGAALRAVTQSRLTYKTGIGEQRTLILADGSTVTMNALTTVRVNMTPKTREVTLVRGQAYFHDTDEPARPFVVRTGTSAVRAIGTEFDVEKEPDRTVVTVVEGQVAVAKSPVSADRTQGRLFLQESSGPVLAAKEVLVSAGEQVILARNVPAPSRVDVTEVTAWMQQRLIFDDTPLENVAEQFNLYSKRRLVIADRSLRGIGVSGEYSASDPGALIGFLRSQSRLRVIEKSDMFVVTRP